MPLKDYSIKKYLGRGSYGSAILVCLKKNPKKLFVMKEIVMANLKESEKKNAFKEYELLSKLNHPTIVRFHENFVENDRLYIVMEYADGGDLSEYIKNFKRRNERIPTTTLMSIFILLCLSIDYIHKKNILHRDIKTQNVFLKNNAFIKLGDFGISKLLDSSTSAKTQIGTPYYLSPELCMNTSYSYSSDVWALGVILYELIFLELPFLGENIGGLLYNIMNNSPNFEDETINKILKYYKNRKEDEEIILFLIRICKSMLKKEAKERITIDKILDMKMIKHHMRLISLDEERFTLNSTISPAHKIAISPVAPVASAPSNRSKSPAPSRSRPNSPIPQRSKVLDQDETIKLHSNNQGKGSELEMLDEAHQVLFAPPESTEEEEEEKARIKARERILRRKSSILKVQLDNKKKDFLQQSSGLDSTEPLISATPFSNSTNSASSINNGLITTRKKVEVIQEEVYDDIDDWDLYLGEFEAEYDPFAGEDTIINFNNEMNELYAQDLNSFGEEDNEEVEETYEKLILKNHLYQLSEKKSKDVTDGETY